MPPQRKGRHPSGAVPRAGWYDPVGGSRHTAVSGVPSVKFVRSRFVSAATRLRAVTLLSYTGPITMPGRCVV